MKFAKLFFIVLVGGILCCCIGLFNRWATGLAASLTSIRASEIEVSVALPGFQSGPWASPKPGQLVIRAQAHVTASLDTNPYVWYVEVKNKDGETIAKKVYGDQPFRVAHGKDLHPDFADSWDWVPGAYRVDVGLMNDLPVRTQGAMISFDEIVSGN
jgi:hypothetical protein